VPQSSQTSHLEDPFVLRDRLSVLEIGRAIRMCGIL